MIDYETYCRIHDLSARQHMNFAQIARTLGLHWETVAKWLREPRYRPAAAPRRRSRMDPYKPLIVKWLDSHPYTAQQIFQRLREEGFEGGISIVKDYVHTVRPKRQTAFLKLAFAPGDCAQVDWGCWNAIDVGSTRRRLSFFLMVLCYCRLMYLEFFVSQTMEHFLAGHEHAFRAIGGVPQRIMVDNLRSAVLQHWVGCAPVFNPHYLAFARHWGFDIVACNPRAGNEKGRVENGVGYVKKNLLGGLTLPDFSGMAPVAQHWLETVANVRVHGETQRRPVDLFEEERGLLIPLNPRPYDIGRVLRARVSKQCRVTLDANHYTVPPKHAGTQVIVKAYPDRLCIYAQDELIARHVRSYDRHQDIEDPDHAKALEAQRKHAVEQRLWLRYSKLSPRAQCYYQGLLERRGNAAAHVRKIVALAEIYSEAAVARAIEDALEFQAFSCEYIANLLEMRARPLPEAGALQLIRRQDLLDLDLDEPDLSAYEVPDDEDR